MERYPAGRSGTLTVGHVRKRDRHDAAVPIPATVHGWPEFEVDAECQSCPARSELSFGGPGALLIVVHADGCPAVEGYYAQLAGAR